MCARARAASRHADAKYLAKVVNIYIKIAREGEKTLDFAAKYGSWCGRNTRLRTLAGWGGRPKGEPASVCRFQRNRQFQFTFFLSLL